MLVVMQQSNLKRQWRFLRDISRFSGLRPKSDVRDYSWECSGDTESPWVRQVVSGPDLSRNPRYSKGFAFDLEERDRLHLRGLFPSAVVPQNLQVKCILMNIQQKRTNLEKYHYLLSLYERNERLFYRVLIDNFEDLLPIVHNPTVRIACQNSPIMFRTVPRGIYISIHDRGHISKILENWPNQRIKLIVITDGANVGPLLDPNEEVDLGVEAMGVPVSKLFMYTVCGGIDPSACLPVSIDIGTNNKQLLNSPFYVGVKKKRAEDSEYMELMDEFLTEVKRSSTLSIFSLYHIDPPHGVNCRRYGNTVLLQFVDMKHETAMQMVSMYRSEFPCLHDGSHGRAATMLAGVFSALPLTKQKLKDHRVLIVGEGSMVSITAEMFAMAVVLESGESFIGGRHNIWIVDSKGLVVRERTDRSTIEEDKLPFMHVGKSCQDLESAVEYIKPTILVGCSFTTSAPFKFTKQVCKVMAEHSSRPIIFPLSPSGSECKISDLMKWTDDRAIVANIEGSKDSTTLKDGTLFTPRQCHTTYVFPGIALGTLMSRSNSLRFEQFIAAAEAVSKLVTKQDVQKGLIYPPLNDIRQVAAHVAQAVAQKSYEQGTATNLPKPQSLLQYAQQYMHFPQYTTYR